MGTELCWGGCLCVVSVVCGPECTDTASVCDKGGCAVWWDAEERT